MIEANPTLACKELNRRFVGSEIDKNYYEIAVERLNNPKE